jgi:hypothetical protein
MVFVKDKGLKRDEETQEKRGQEVKLDGAAGGSVFIGGKEASVSKIFQREGIELDSNVESVPKSVAKI